jgi:hypothetical protein
MQIPAATTFVQSPKPIRPPYLMTPPRQPRRRGRFSDDHRRAHEAEQRWRKAGYGPELIERLRWDRSYSVLRIGNLELAYSDYGAFRAALGAAWDAGYVPAPGHSSVRGADLPDVAPSLSGLDVDLSSQDVLPPRHQRR